MPAAAAPESVITERSKEAQARVTTVRLLQILAAAALLFPLFLFSFASWLSYRGEQALTNERIERSLDVMQEQALKVFLSIKLALDTIDDLLANRSESEIQADEGRLHERLSQIEGTLPEVQSIWIFGPTGHPQVMTRAYPALTAGDYSENDYFRVPRDGPAGVYIGSIHQSVSGGQPYFTFNRARHGADGKFAGVIELSLLPSDFSRFYSRLASGSGLQYALVRDDGTMLARFPPPPQGEPHLDEVRLDERSGFHRVIAANPAGGFYTTKSEVDNIERRLAVRRLPGFPVYLSAGIDTAQIRNEWMGGMAVHLIFGIPATVFLFGAIIVVLQRTKHLYAEQDRREAAEAAIRQAQKMEAVGQLTGGIAHDFNNMLAVIRSSLDLMRRRIEKGDFGVDRFMEAAHKATERAAALTHHLLAFARQQPLKPEPVNANRMIADMSDLLRSTLGEHIRIETVTAAGLWVTTADANQLENAVLNIAINARDAMPDGGKLTIETANAFLDDAYCSHHAEVRPGQYVMIAITDSGEGMKPEVAARAFDPFFTTKPAGKGTGLGLSQVYGFVRQSRGHVKIYSEIGAGTTVKIYLPRLIGGVESKERRRPQPKQIGNPSEVILVVEDDPLMRRLSTDSLIELGYTVLDSENAVAALSILDGRPDIKLLFTDVVMPDINGRKLADEALRRRPDLKVLFTTGYTKNAVVHGGVLDAEVNLLSKPFTLEQLAAKVRMVLDT
jgi:signal transduction histidine kinase/CheY-like chemotaxis protein